MAIFDKFLKAIKKVFGKRRQQRKNKKRRKKRPQKKINRRKKSGKKISKKTASKRLKRKSSNLRNKVRKQKKFSKGSWAKAPNRVSKKKLSVGKANNLSVKNGKAKSKTSDTDKNQNQEVKEILVGEITHYFSKIMVVVLKMTGHYIRVGEVIRIKGNSTDFVQKVDSIQIESVNVQMAKKGQLVGLKVGKPAKINDQVYKLIKNNKL